MGVPREETAREAFLEILIIIMLGMMPCKFAEAERIVRILPDDVRSEGSGFRGLLSRHSALKQKIVSLR